MERMTIYTKGTAKENPGPSAIGVYVVDSKGEMILEISESIGNATHDYAEYFAVVRGLQLVADKFGDDTSNTQFELKLESELVRNHLSAEEQIKDVSLIGHFIEIYNLRVASFPNLTITLVKKELNKEANHLVDGALDRTPNN